jgi:penicillin-binding protein 1C
MDWLHRGDPQHARAKITSLPPAAPPGVIQQKIRFEPPRETPRSEWFIAGTETSIVRAATGNTLARISYPADGSIIALDPDIPPPRQRVPLRTSATAEPGSVWRMDSVLLGKAATVSSWLPQPGKHRLRLESRSGEIIDSVTFEVRALKAKNK